MHCQWGGNPQNCPFPLRFCQPSRGPSHGHKQHAQKRVKIARVAPEICWRTDRQTHRLTDRHTQTRFNHIPLMNSQENGALCLRQLSLLFHDKTKNRSLKPKRLARKNVYKMASCVELDVKPSFNQSINSLTVDQSVTVIQDTECPQTHERIFSTLTDGGMFIVVTGKM